ncbi:hypothetical protein ARMGADRAFT_1166664 [Armillaria gallica]|uniref:GST N-terminal domain-containing protein n=1 Tax=Armillaria gallica TaxID=47427 RepID=A0A2H3DJV1_ARMGA|nr:hypothetical protein ARMGADRAFT_1166664 [Armillaria gallica]
MAFRSRRRAGREDGASLKAQNLRSESSALPSPQVPFFTLLPSILLANDTNPLGTVQSPEREVAFVPPFPQLFPPSLVFEKYTAVTSFGQKNGRITALEKVIKRVENRQTTTHLLVARVFVKPKPKSRLVAASQKSLGGWGFGASFKSVLGSSRDKDRMSGLDERGAGGGLDDQIGQYSLERSYRFDWQDRLPYASSTSLINWFFNASDATLTFRRVNVKQIRPTIAMRAFSTSWLRNTAAASPSKVWPTPDKTPRTIGSSFPPLRTKMTDHAYTAVDVSDVQKSLRRETPPDLNDNGECHRIQWGTVYDHWDLGRSTLSLSSNTTLPPFFLTRLLYTTRRAPLIFPLPAVLLLPVTYPRVITLYGLPFKAANSPGIDYQDALNLKNLPYQTHEAILQDDSTGAVFSDSAAIAAHLDKTYPSGPVLIPTGTMTLQLAFADAINDAFNHLRLSLFYSDMAVKMNDRKTVYKRMKLMLEAPEGEEREKL